MDAGIWNGKGGVRVSGRGRCLARERGISRDADEMPRFNLPEMEGEMEGGGLPTSLGFHSGFARFSDVFEGFSTTWRHIMAHGGWGREA